MRVLINQQPQELPEHSTVADALQALAQAAPDGGSPRGPCAVAVNLQFVPRSQHAHTPLHEGDRVEVLTPITGG